MLAGHSSAFWNISTMDNGIHFISGLPRSGSTLLSAILRQNPKFHAGMSSPVAPLWGSLVASMGARSEWADLVDDEQRLNISQALFDGYYRKIHPTKLVFDTNRLWCAKMDVVALLFPEAKVIVCVRDLPWIMDSFERLYRKNPLLTSKMYSPDTSPTVYTRTSSLSSPTGTVGMPWDAVQEAFYGDHAHRLIVVDYEALAREPQRTISQLYGFLGLPYFEHDFENVVYEDGGEFDTRLGVPGLHLVKGAVRFVDRPTVLPPDVFQRFSNRAFWRNPKSNPRKVRVLLPLEPASSIITPPTFAQTPKAQTG
jgi:sulfotransferase